MNVSDPLWNAPKPATSKNSTASNGSQHSITDDSKVAHLDRLQPEMKLGGAGIGAIIESLSKEKMPLFAGDQESRSLTSSSTNTSTLTQSGVDAIVSAIKSQSSPHLWSFKQFWYIAAAATAITILLPLIAGTTFRTTLRSFNHYKSYWRVSLFVPVLAAVITLDVVIPPAVFLIVSAVPQCIFVVWRLGWAHIKGRQKKRWIGFATVLGVCIVSDLSIPGATQARKIINFGGNIGLTGWIPTSYLFVVWIQAEPPLISLTRMNRVKELFAPRIKSIAGGMRRIRESRTYKSHKLAYDYLLFGVAASINAGVSYLTPGLIYPVATGIPLSLYSLDKLLKPARPNDRYWWIIIIAIIAISEFFTLNGSGDLVGLSGILPGIALWAFFRSNEIMSWLRKHFPRLFTKNPPVAGAIDPEPGISLSATPVSQQLPQ